MPRQSLKNGELKLEFKKVGRNDASTFSGLCSRHDTELFKTVDTELFDDNDCIHRRQIAYRSVMHELSTELENAARANAMHYELCKAEKKDPDKTETVYVHLWKEWMVKSHKVYRYRRRHFDRPMENGKEPSIRHLIITMDNQAPVLACSSLFSTGFTSEDDIVGPTLNVIPLSPAKTVALLSCPSVA